jgi:hypothetical protein
MSYRGACYFAGTMKQSKRRHKGIYNSPYTCFYEGQTAMPDNIPQYSPWNEYNHKQEVVFSLFLVTGQEYLYDIVVHFKATMNNHVEVHRVDKSKWCEYYVYWYFYPLVYVAQSFIASVVAAIGFV